MPSIYVNKKVKAKLDKFIKSTRESPQFGAKNKYPNPNRAIEFLLEIGLKFPLSSLEKIARQPFIQFSMRMTDSEFSKIEESGKLREIISEKFKKEESEDEAP